MCRSNFHGFQTMLGKAEEVKSEVPNVDITICARLFHVVIYPILINICKFLFSNFLGRMPKGLSLNNFLSLKRVLILVVF